MVLISQRGQRRELGVLKSNSTADSAAGVRLDHMDLGLLLLIFLSKYLFVSLIFYFQKLIASCWASTRPRSKQFTERHF